LASRSWWEVVTEFAVRFREERTDRYGLKR
jgi:hypothetical protein